MTKKILSKLFSLLTAFFVCIALLLCIAFGLMQTQWFKDTLTGAIEQEAKKKGITLQIGALSGMAPLSFSLQDLCVHIDETSFVFLEKITLRISISDLVKGKLTISYLSVDKAEYHFSEPSMTWQELERLKLKLPKIPPLPFSIASRHVLIRSAHLIRNDKEDIAVLSILGKAKIRHDLSEVLLHLKISYASSPNIYTQLFIDGSEKMQYLQAKADLYLPSAKMLSPLVDLPFDGKIQLKSQWKGAWSSWKEAVYSSGGDGSAINISFAAEAKELNVPTYPFLNTDWRLKGAFQIIPGKKLLCKTLSIDSPTLRLHTDFSLAPKGRIESSKGSFTAVDIKNLSVLSPFPLSGKVVGGWSYSPKEASMSLCSDALIVAGEKITSSELKASLYGIDSLWKGDMHLNALVGQTPISLQADLMKDGGEFFMHHLIAEGAGLTFCADTSYSQDSHVWHASIFVEDKDLRALRVFLPKESNASGSLAFSSQLTYDSHHPTSLSGYAHLLMNNIRYRDALIGKLSSDCIVEDLLHTPKGKVSILAEGILTPDLFVKNLFLTAEENGDTHPFSIRAEGRWKKEGNVELSGYWRQDSSDVAIALSHIEGSLLGHPIRLEAPFQIEIGDDLRSISNVQLKIDEGCLTAKGCLTRDEGQMQLCLEHVPLDMFLLPLVDLSAIGSISSEAALNVKGGRPQGYLHAVLEKGELKHEDGKAPLQAKGSLQAHLSKDALQVFTHLTATAEQFIDMTLTAPITVGDKPWKLCIDKDRALSAELTAEGELEALFDFINIGTQKAEGLATTHLFLSSSLSAPSLQGTFHLANGTYQNYAIGTRLKNIDAEIEAERGSLVIKALTAEGKKGGIIEATGSMQLSPKLHMPFEIQGKLKDIQFLNFDYLSSSFTGDLTLEGTTEAALLKGQVEATNVDVSLSEEIPAKIPELDINYVNRPVHLQGAKLSSQTFYPFNYDVKIETKDRVFIKGRGLDSLWKGDLHLLGHNAEVSAEGRLSLVKGDYIFAGKKFSLQEGEITFVDKPTPQAFIKIGGMLQLSDVQVMVSVQGPLESPTFTMHSIPHMPTSALLSRILFNKDISEITAVEALQLANVLVSMTGTTGPDVLENIRRSIGVDRLTIVGKEGSDEISLQIGWYLTHGVTVSLSQSATSSDVTIEVDLKHGFIFQAETQNQEEGKFSLKWNKNY